MPPVAIGLLAFGLALAGILLGSVMQRMLPKGQLSPDSKEGQVKLGDSCDTGRSSSWAIGR